MGVEDIPKQGVQCKIIGLKEESWGLVVTAENGPTKLEWVASGAGVRRNFRIGQVVRADITVTEV